MKVRIIGEHLNENDNGTLINQNSELNELDCGGG